MATDVPCRLVLALVSLLFRNVLENLVEARRYYCGCSHRLRKVPADEACQISESNMHPRSLPSSRVCPPPFPLPPFNLYPYLPPADRNSLTDRSREYRRGDATLASPPRGGPSSAPGPFGRRDSGPSAAGGKDYGREAWNSGRASSTSAGGSRGGGGLLWGEERDRDRGRGSASPFSRNSGGEVPPSLGGRHTSFTGGGDGGGSGADSAGAPFHNHGRGRDYRDAAAATAGATDSAAGAGCMDVDGESGQDRQQPSSSPPTSAGAGAGAGGFSYPHPNHAHPPYHQPRGGGTLTGAAGGSGSGSYHGGSGPDNGAAETTAASGASPDGFAKPGNGSSGGWRASDTSTPPLPQLRVTNPEAFEGGGAGESHSGAGWGGGDRGDGGAHRAGTGGQSRPMPTRLSGLAAIIAARSEDSPEKPVRFCMFFFVVCWFFLRVRVARGDTRGCVFFRVHTVARCGVLLAYLGAASSSIGAVHRPLDGVEYELARRSRLHVLFVSCWVRRIPTYRRSLASPC